MSSSSQATQRPSMASRFTNSPVITRLRNSPVISAAKRWAAGKASLKPQLRDPNPRRYSGNNGAQNITKDTEKQNQITSNEDINGTNPPMNKMAKFARNASPRLKKNERGIFRGCKRRLYFH